jgi:imidazole glycerol phosphate synthase, glutamine amidotransferase subunit
MIAIIDYKAGNITSVRLAFEAIGAEAVVSDAPEVIRRADRIVFPGVGAAGSAMKNLRAAGLDALVRERIAAGAPFLGICLGTQILFESSEEDGGVPALGVLRGSVKKFARHESPAEAGGAGIAGAWEKIPHMGWNQAEAARPHPLLEGVADKSYFYFVHSYHPAPADEADVICRTRYCGVDFASMVGRGNVAATQFHPEKSGEVGLRILENFSRWEGAC